LQAAQRTRFYRQAMRGLDPATTPLSALPVCGKVELMRHFADHVADPALALTALRAFCADPARIGQPFDGRCWVWESSGSTGEPALFVQDPTAMAVYDALEGTRRSPPHPWARLIDPLYLGERFALVGAHGGHFASHVSAMRLRAANPWVQQHSHSFSILQPTPALVAHLNRFAPSILATYPTAAVLLAEEARRGALRLHLREIWTGGETLTPAMRARIEQAFGCALRNSYGASEFLPIAWECGHGRLHVNADWVILEPVDAQHRPVRAGQVSHTTLLTNLANHVQPLIRFDIGDSIRLPPAPCPCGSALPVVEVQGRHDDMLEVGGREGALVTLLPLALTTVLEDVAGVFDFQIEQRDATHLRLSLGPGAPRTRATRERCREVLFDFAQAQGALGLHLSIRELDLLPLGRSGKLKRVVAITKSAAR
jgi:phenylacetate-coenzyme A ligase PaaK-like adenylate-forming protein